MKVTRRGFLGSAAACAALAAGGCAAQAGRGQSYATKFVHTRYMNTVFHWTDVALQAIRDQGVAPPQATRALAMGHVAAFAAVNGLNNRYQTRYSAGAGPVGADPDVAYGIAFATAIGGHFQQTFSADQLRFLAAHPDGNAKDLGVTWGKSVGRQIIKLRTGDGAEPNRANHYPGRYPRRGDILQWEPTGPFYDANDGPAIRPTFQSALLPGFGAVKPWSISSAAAYRAPNFPDPRSRIFAEELREVRELGRSDSTVRTADQSQIAIFWEDGPWGTTPPGHFTLIAMQILQGANLGLVDLARAFALISMAMADAAIATWDSKYHHDVVRPETMIRKRAASLSNPHVRFANQPGWKSYIPTPPFPAYTSGHSAFGAAAMGVLRHVLGRDNIAFSSRAPDAAVWPRTLQGVTRHWPSLSAAAEENGLSRVYGGVHWHADNDQALKAGYAIAKHVAARETKPLA